MPQPEPPAPLPEYLVKGLPKQYVDALRDAREYVDALIEYYEQPIE